MREEWDNMGLEFFTTSRKVWRVGKGRTIQLFVAATMRLIFKRRI
jgi:hypothetical protein